MKVCPFCAEEIQEAAIVCKHCKRDLVPISSLPPQSPAASTFNPGVAAVLSLLIPGAGQIYRGDIGLGILWLLFTIIGYALFIVPGIVLHVICIFTAASRPKPNDYSPARGDQKCRQCGHVNTKRRIACTQCGTQFAAKVE